MNVKARTLFGFTKHSLLTAATFLVMCLLATHASAMLFSLPDSDEHVIGQPYVSFVEPGDTVSKIARRHGVGYYELIEANPDLRHKRLKQWSKINIPSQYILPDGPREGVVVNLAEMRLYYYIPNSNMVMTYPVGIGKIGWNTPLGETKVVEKMLDPDWYVPKSIREAAARRGKHMPKIVKAGPDNPLGRHAMRLGLTSGAYLIHSTNLPKTVGKRGSSGCIRMYPEDAEELFYQISPGDKVTVVNQHYKAGWLGGKLYVEAHEPVSSEDHFPDTVEDVVSSMAGDYLHQIDWGKVSEVARDQNGMPQPVLW